MGGGGGGHGKVYGDSETGYADVSVRRRSSSPTTLDEVDDTESGRTRG